MEESCHNLIECNRDYTKQKQVQIHNLDLHLFRLLDYLYFIIFEKKNQDFIFLSKILISVLPIIYCKPTFRSKRLTVYNFII